MKRIISLLCALSVLLASVTVCVSAKTAVETVGTSEEIVIFGDPADVLSQYMDTDEFEEYIDPFVITPSSSFILIDISKFNIPDTELNKEAILNLVCDQNPRYIHLKYWVSSVYSEGDDGYLDYLSLMCTYYGDQFTDMLAKTEEKANQMVADLLEYPELSDYEKAAILHARLVAACEYIDDGYTYSQTAYGPLVLGQSVCAGYAEAYAYLLDKVGIRNYKVQSDNLNHAWNVVYLDGVPYNVDVTWDDFDYPINLDGTLNFPHSSEVFAKTHNASDYYLPENDTKYDNMLSAVTAPQHYKGSIYYLDKYDIRGICRYTGGEPEVLLKNKDIQGVASNGYEMYYNTDYEIYKFDPENRKHEKIYALDPSYISENLIIDGLGFVGEDLVIDMIISDDFDCRREVIDTSVRLPDDYITYLIGDVNGDGVVNVRDATAVQKWLAAILSIDDIIAANADFNQDDKVNVKDVTAIQKFVAGIK